MRQSRQPSRIGSRLGNTGKLSRNHRNTGKTKVLTEQQGEIYRQMVAFRNRIAHRYAETDFTEVYEIMTKQLSDLDDFVEAIINYCHL